MKTVFYTLNSLFLILLLLVGGFGVKTVAQNGMMGGMLSGRSRQWAAPAYLKSVHITTATTTNVTQTPAVLGCVVVNKAGAAGSTITLYNGSAAAGTVLGIVDGATVGGTFCYGLIVNGYLQVVTASGGAVADITITYQS